MCVYIDSCVKESREVIESKNKEIEEIKKDCENQNNNNVRLKNLLKEYEKK